MSKVLAQVTRAYRLMHDIVGPAGFVGMSQNGALFGFSQITLKLKADPLQFFDMS